MNSKLRKFSLFFLLLFVVCFGSICRAENATVGIVVLHGKDSVIENSLITPLVQKLKQQGFIVAAPEMPYSKFRKYDKSYEDTMPEIDDAVNGLKKCGAKKIFVAGHSLGANVVLYYATVARIDGVLAIAPGHRPETAKYQETMHDSLLRARQMVKEGRGNDRKFFKDSNQGKISFISVPAVIYLSWFDPEGSAIMPDNARKMKPGTALLWVVGKSDPIYKAGPQYAFDLAPPDKRNKYLVVNADHMNTPAAAAEEISAWLEAVTK